MDANYIFASVCAYLCFSEEIHYLCLVLHKKTMNITIPYTVANFADLREQGFYYVDKTGFIPRPEQYNVPVFRAYVVLEKSIGIYTGALLRP